MRRRRRPEHFAGDVPFVRGEENQIAFFDPQALSRSASFSASVKNFTIGDFHSPFSILMKASPFAPKCLRDLGQLIDLADREMPRNPLALIAFTTPPLSSALRKTLKLLSAKHVRQDRPAPCRNGGPACRCRKSSDRFAIGHARERRRDFDAARGFEDRGEHSFDEREDVVRLDERSFDVDLREFRLPIGAQIFVAETFRDLEIFFDPADHEQLLVLLRRLRQRVKFPRREAARDEEIARAFRRALRKNRRLDFEETLLVEIIARRFGDPMTQAQIARKLRPAQIEIAIGQAQIFVARIRHRAGTATTSARFKNARFCGSELDVAGGQFRVFRARERARAT